MSIKTVLALTPDAPGSEAILAPATAFAEAEGAHLTILVLAATADFAYAGEIGAQVLAEQMEHARESARQTAGRLGERLTAQGAIADVRTTAGGFASLAEQVERHGRYADLLVIGRRGDSDDELADDLNERAFEAALFGSGRPVVLVPAEWKEAFGKRIMIGWDGSREAARAIALAMPLIERADEVRITIAITGSGAARHGEEPGADLGTALARHNPNVEVDRLPPIGRKISDTLMNHARDRDADLLVLGGYGHSRLSEAVFGGVTHDLSRQASVPVLMAH